MWNGASDTVRKLKRRLDGIRSGGREAARFSVLTRLARSLMPEYKLNWHQIEWFKDADFNAYLAKFDETHGLNSGRRWMVHQLLRMIADVPGDTAECGVYKGATSYLICKANEQSPAAKRTHFVFDSFEGLSDPSELDGTHWHKGDLSVGEAVVMDNLREFRDVKLMKGWIPARFGEVADRRFAFVHVDVDLYEPTRDSIEFFYPRLNEGGILLIDDFGFASCPGATRALAEASGGAGGQMIALSDGGGFLIKGRSLVPAARLT